MSVIDRNILNKNLTLTIYKSLDYSYTLPYSQIINLIDRAKTYLLIERNAAPGDRVFISTCDLYLIWLIACAELGLVLLVSASHNVSHFTEYKHVYGEINHVIVSYQAYFQFVIDEFGERCIDSEIIKTYENTDKKDEIYASADSMLTLSTSESNIKNFNFETFNHTHNFYYRLLCRNGHLYQLQELDKCMHNKILHHGSSLGTFFLPTIMFCRYHFWVPEHLKWNQIIIKEKINRCLFMYYDIIAFRAKSANRQYDLSFLKIYTLRSPGDRELDYYIKQCDSTIISIFGTTLTSGPVFLQTVNKNNINKYDKFNFGTLLDNFYQVDIDFRSNLTIKTFDNKQINTFDQFKLVENIFYLVL